MKSSSIVGLLCASIAMHEATAEVYKWVDQAGKTHFGDTVPQQDQPAAKPVNLHGAASVSAERRRDAQQRSAAAQGRLRAAENQAGAKAVAPIAEPDPTPPKPRPRTSEEKLADFRASQECFDPFHNYRGTGIKPEAFSQCSEIKDPAGVSER